MSKLDAGQKNFLRLAVSGAEKSETGWAKVSATLMPLVKEMPSELLDVKEESDGSGFCRITDKGRTVLEWT